MLTGGTATGSPPGNQYTRVAIIAVAVIACWFFFLRVESPKIVINRCLDSIEQWNGQQCLDCIPPSERGEYQGLPEFFARMKASGVQVRFNDRHITPAETNGDSCTANVTYVVSLTNPGQPPRTAPMSDTVLLVKVDRKWYIHTSSNLQAWMRYMRERRGM